MGATTLGIMTLRLKGLYETFSISDSQYNNAECRILFIMLNVVMLSVVAPVINENLNKLQFRFAPFHGRCREY